MGGPENRQERSADGSSPEIEPEFVSTGAVVLLSSPFNCELDFQRLEEFANALPQRNPISYKMHDPVFPIQAMPVRQAVLSPFEVSPLDMADGRICADARIPCPPGVPIVMPGEVIDKKIRNILKMYGINDIKVVK